jgi:hypothetical protein
MIAGCQHPISATSFSVTFALRWPEFCDPALCSGRAVARCSSGLEQFDPITVPGIQSKRFFQIHQPPNARRIKIFDLRKG